MWHHCFSNRQNSSKFHTLWNFRFCVKYGRQATAMLWHQRYNKYSVHSSCTKHCTNRWRPSYKPWSVIVHVSLALPWTWLEFSLDQSFILKYGCTVSRLADNKSLDAHCWLALRFLRSRCSWDKKWSSEGDPCWGVVSGLCATRTCTTCSVLACGATRLVCAQNMTRD